MSLTPVEFSLVLSKVDWTGGVNLFRLLGRIKSLIADRVRPLHGQRCPESRILGHYSKIINKPLLRGDLEFSPHIFMNKIPTARALTAASLTFGSLVGGVNAATILDQEQTVTTVAVAQFGSSVDLAQSFQQSGDTISGAGIFVSDFGTAIPTAMFTISLFDALPNDGGTQIASGNTVGMNESWADVSWTPVPIIPDTEYFLVFESSEPNYGIRGGGTISVDVYSRGLVYAGPGFPALPDFDYAFRTFADPIPEPSSALLLGLGSLGITFRRRRDRKAC